MNFTMKKTILILMTVFRVLSTESKACIRTDLDDRPLQEALSKSKSLGSSQPFSNLVGSIFVNEETLSTGIALDKHTILTAAHCHEQEAETITFSLNPNAISAFLTDDYKLYTVTTRPLVHPSFRMYERKIVSTWRENQRFVNDIPLATVSKFNFDEYNKHFAGFSKFEGADLAILKLDEPLPDGYTYPDLLNMDKSIIDIYGTCLGFGPMKFNFQEPGPTPVTCEQEQMCIRHLISNCVSSYTYPDNHRVFYGKYHGLVKNGEASFIPHKNMMKTEGLMLGGDSGGPLFIKVGNNVLLAGLYSNIACAFPFHISDDQEHRDVLGEMTQPVFPIWTDVRYYADWIKEHMGPKQQ